MASHRVFVYGTLKRGQPNSHLLQDGSRGQVKFVSEARTVECWPLVVAGKLNIPYLLDRKHMGKHVRGEVYEVDDRVLEVLDELEEHPTLYTRGHMDITYLSPDGRDSTTRQVLGYSLRDFNEELLELPMLEEYKDSPERPYSMPDGRPPGVTEEQKAFVKPASFTFHPDQYS